MSSYAGAQALQWDALDVAYPQVQPEYAPDFDVVEGQGLDALARQGVTTSFVTAIRATLIAATIFIILGICRVTLSSLTVALLQDNLACRTQIQEMAEENDALRAERSALSNATRIERIAEQELGMVHANERACVRLTVLDQQTSAQSDMIQQDSGA